MNIKIIRKRINIAIKTGQLILLNISPNGSYKYGRIGNIYSPLILDDEVLAICSASSQPDNEDPYWGYYTAHLERVDEITGCRLIKDYPKDEDWTSQNIEYMY